MIGWTKTRILHGPKELIKFDTFRVSANKDVAAYYLKTAEHAKVTLPKTQEFYG